MDDRIYSDVVVATWMDMTNQGTTLYQHLAEKGRATLKLEMEGLLQFTANTPFNVEAVKTKQNNQTTIRITVSINLSKMLKSGRSRFGIKSKNGVKPLG